MVHYIQLIAVNPQSDYAKLHGVSEMFQKLGQVDRFHLLDRVEMSDEQLIAHSHNAFSTIDKIVLAKENTHLLGFIATSKGDPGCISALFVDEQHRRQGIAKELVRQIKEMIPGKARVNTVVNNKEAIAFYQSLGFIPITVGLVEID